ncbi:sensor histidine kinase [Streptomyces apricus]|uniref:histidine kinase n=1 Tax=Streptomyces apricus TaxID=1828112 RepID=A0A5B0B090_9ACTN|nr:histidine kinase dimerization/phospho-acceptor domain-containing protein [Streptomyces apricus]KAA0935464.1 HAMP domain-containing protein [Streptomyces apricus]
MIRRLPFRFRRGHGHGHGVHSLRGQLTLANVVLLALGIVMATAVSLMGMRYYLLDQIDSELFRMRDSLQGTQLTARQIDSLSALAFIRDGKVPESMGPPNADTLFAVVDAKGAPLTFRSLVPTPNQRALAAAVGDSPQELTGDADPREVTVDGSAFRVVGVPLADGTVVLVAGSTDALHKGMAKALKLDLFFGVLLLALLAVLTMLSVGRRLRPLEDMVETSSAIAEGDLARRVPSSHHPTQEVEQLRLALNSMLHQVESAYRTRERSAAQLRRFVADASHELRTPLSAIRGYLQLYDKGMLREPAERKRAWDRMTGEADRMGRLVDELLTLARLDQRPELRFRNVDLARLVRDAAEDLRAQQPGRPVTVSAEGALLVRADESGLRQVLGNLVANVRTHTPADVAVALSLERVGGVVRVCASARSPPGSPAPAAAPTRRPVRAAPPRR